MRVPRIFIGSSSEGKDVAERLAARLESDGSTEANVWTQGVFDLGEHVLDGLIRHAQTSDFAVLVLSPDDSVSSRAAVSQAPRDNVVFELGLFIGALGKERTYMVQPHNLDLKLPSDLAGITQVRYPLRQDGNMTAALTSAGIAILDQVKKIGIRAAAQAGPAATDGSQPTRTASQDASPPPQFDVALIGGAHIILPAVESRDHLVENQIETARREQVKDPDESGPFALNLSSARALLGISALSPAAFEAKAAAWKKEIVESWSNILNELASATLPAPVIKVSNVREQFLESVRVDILFKNAAGIPKNDLEDLDLHSLIPEVVPTSHPYGFPQITPYFPPSGTISSYPLTWRNEPDGLRVVIELSDLRPKTPWVSDGDDFVLIAHASEILAEWRVTARGYHQSFEGTSPVPILEQHDFHSLLALTGDE